jgi:hypothetical protein
MHLLIDISAHGFGHLAQTAPVIRALRAQLPHLRLTIRSALPRLQLEHYLTGHFEHECDAQDFGFAMHNSVDIDFESSARAYKDLHQQWQKRIDVEAAWIKVRKFTAVITNVAYLPLAAAERAGVPSASLSSINWADLFIHYFAAEPWAAKIHAEILAAYRSAHCFLRVSPGLPMTDLNRRHDIGPIARLGTRDKGALARRLNIVEDNRHVLLAMGGFDFRLPVESWARVPGIDWIVPAAWQVRHKDAYGIDPSGINFADLLASADAIITKPGYGTFVEAACNAIPILYLQRDDWPETRYLSAWLDSHARACAVSRDHLMRGNFIDELEQLWSTQPPATPLATGAEEAAALLQTVLRLH